MNDENGGTREPYAGILVVGGIRVPRYAQVQQEYVPRTTAAMAVAAATSLSAGEHDGTICDAKPNGLAVYGTTDDDARASTDANDAVAANDGTATTEDGANCAFVSHGAATTLGLTEHAVVGPASTALCWIWNGITHGEELFKVRDGQTGSFKQ